VRPPVWDAVPAVRPQAPQQTIAARLDKARKPTHGTKILVVTIAGHRDFLPSTAFPYAACSQRGVLAIFVRAASTCDVLERARALQVCRLCPARPECNRAAAGMPPEQLKMLGIVGGQDYTRTVPIGTVAAVTDGSTQT
jgi:hypothetical protein